MNVSSAPPLRLERALPRLDQSMPRASESKISKVETSSEKPPKYVIYPKYVKEALNLDKGKDAELISWTLKDFTSKGDNFVSVITSVIVKYKPAIASEVRDVTYVIKIKQTAEDGSSSDFNDMVFNKEGKFFTELLPQLNSELISIDQQPLKIPRFLHHKWFEDQNQIFLNDVRARGFRMYDRKKGLDVKHTKLVLQELARLHAISYLLQHKRPNRALHEDHPFLDWEWFTYSRNLRKSFEILVKEGLVTASLLAKHVGKEKLSDWYTSIAPEGVKELEKQLICNSPSFNVIGHGDCWINNLLFKYDDEGSPIDVVLLDLQFCRQSSVGVDLNYFFFTSLERAERIRRTDELMAAYHLKFKCILSAASVAMPFTLEELREECSRKNLFGLIMSSLLLPNILCDLDDIQGFDAGADGCANSYAERKRIRSIRLLEKSAVFKKRMVDLFDDIIQILGVT